MTSVDVAAVYHFTPLANLPALRPQLHALLMQHGLRGTLLIAPEGFNGTLAGARADLERGLEAVRGAALAGTLDVKWSTAARQPFRRTKVRIKREIVSMGIDAVNPLAGVGTYVEAEQWDALIADPNVLVVDARNHYEVRIGSFEGARDPATSAFRELPAYLDAMRAEYPDRKIAMFCTGGIRCEKASAYLRGQGFDEVYHLRGGILRYLERIPAAASSFQGACFVFDERVAVTSGLELADVQMCGPCGSPLSARDREHAEYQRDVRCQYCAATLSARDAGQLRADGEG